MHNPLYAMSPAFENAQGRYAPKARAEMLKELGYAGTTSFLWNDQAWSELPELVRQLDANGLKLLSVWIACDVADIQIDPRLAQAVQLLAGRETLIDLALKSSGEHDKPSAPRADPRAADAINRVADIAAAGGLRVALHPHTNWWMERIEDAVRLGMRVNRPDVGLTFNMIHWLSTDGTELDARLQLALPRLWNLTINGMTKRGERDYTIEPLDSGTFDLFYALSAIARAGYTGPIAWPGFGVGGDVYANLRRTMTAYRDLCARVAKHPAWGRLS